MLLLFRCVRRGWKICVIRIGDKRRVFIVSAQPEAGMVGTGPEG